MSGLLGNSYSIADSWIFQSLGSVGKLKKNIKELFRYPYIVLFKNVVRWTSSEPYKPSFHMIAHDRRIAENTASDRQRLYGNTFQRSGDCWRSSAILRFSVSAALPPPPPPRRPPLIHLDTTVSHDSDSIFKFEISWEKRLSNFVSVLDAVEILAMNSKHAESPQSEFVCFKRYVFLSLSPPTATTNYVYSSHYI